MGERPKPWRAKDTWVYAPDGSLFARCSTAATAARVARMKTEADAREEADRG